jgi:integrase/recombinase XerD
MVPLVRVPRTLPKILAPGEVDARVAALRTQRDRAMVLAMVLGGLRRCELLGLGLADLWVGERRVFIAEGKGGHQRVVPVADRFFAAVGDYLHDERPPAVGDGSRVRGVEGTAARLTVVGRWCRRDPHRRPPAGWPGGGDVSSAAPHCLTRLREAGMALEAVQAQAGHRSIESTRIYLHLTNDWLARKYRRAADLIDTDQTAVNQLVAVQEVATR